MFIPLFYWVIAPLCAARRGSEGLAALGVHETLIDASDAAYRARESAQRAGEKASFLVFDPTGVIVEQIDS